MVPVEPPKPIPDPLDQSPRSAHHHHEPPKPIPDPLDPPNHQKNRPPTSTPLALPATPDHQRPNQTTNRVRSDHDQIMIGDRLIFRHVRSAGRLWQGRYMSTNVEIKLVAKRRTVESFSSDVNPLDADECIELLRRRAKDLGFKPSELSLRAHNGRKKATYRI
jgi:hypothetical protein